MTQKNLVIVESPAKAKTIEKFLGKEYKVMSSYGHIRDLKKKEFSIDTDTFQPEYEIPEDKTKLVEDLKSHAQKAETVWLASDEDREGEAISWHLSEVLQLNPATTKRIVFHEITKSAILQAIENPRNIDINLVNAQQARRVLDRIVGFKLSPVLWKKVKPSLSAGRVQSVAVRLIVEREREIQQFQTEGSYRVSAIFLVPDSNKNTVELKAELNTRFHTQEEAHAFLEKCCGAQFTISDINTRPQKKVPAAPFTTSTLQQEAARKLGFTVAQTMMVAQRLYESGFITYMRTDSVNLSTLCLAQSRDAIIERMGENYVKTRQYATHTKGAQEAHEAIRPTDMSRNQIEGALQERRLYELIWKRTIACQMADAEVEKTTVTIQMDTDQPWFVATGEVVKFDGFLKVYRESQDDENDTAETENLLPAVTIGQVIEQKEINATERFTTHPPRYTEASLVHKMEELGIGRPSTYAPTISTIQQREYVVRGDKPGEKRQYGVLTLKDGQITAKECTETCNSEKGKLLPTDVGTVVNDFLLQYFPNIMDYNFTAKIEHDFDEVAEGTVEWNKLIFSFYEGFNPEVNNALHTKAEHKVGERELGMDPVSSKPVYAKIGRYGPVVQIGSATDTEKPRFAQMKKGQSLETITLEEALKLFALPRTLREFEEKPITIGSGRFGAYIQHNGKYVTLPKNVDPLNVTYEEAVKLIIEKRKAEVEKHLKSFEEEPNMEIMNGRYGPYISFNGQNFRLPKGVTDPKALTYKECLEIISKAPDKPKAPSTRKTAARKK